MDFNPLKLELMLSMEDGSLEDKAKKATSGIGFDVLSAFPFRLNCE